MYSPYRTFSLGLAYLSFTSAYRWPNPHVDEIDHLLFDQTGHKANGIFQSGIGTCKQFTGAETVGRQNTAEVWVSFCIILQNLTSIAICIKVAQDCK
jgi:hypothetical protein